MTLNSAAFKVLVVLVSVLLLISLVSAAEGTEIRVFIGLAFSPALRDLAPEFERATGNKIVTVSGASMGETPEAIPNRLQRGEPADVVIMVGDALDKVIEQGKVLPDTRVDLARSGIAMAVRAGAPKPDISSVDSFKRTLLAAKSIAYSDSASGVYLSTELFPRLGIADQIKGKSRMISTEPVGKVIARGEAEIGFQQMSELLPVPGIDIVGSLPPAIQKITVFSAGIVAGSKNQEAAKALLRYLTSPSAAPFITKTGMEPASPADRK
jgi:molybdate transport system substrate-binding protein